MQHFSHLITGASPACAVKSGGEVGRVGERLKAQGRGEGFRTWDNLQER